MNMKAKDPVCGGTVDPLDGTLHVEHAGEEFYFCSETCLRKFKEQPARFRHPEPI